MNKILPKENSDQNSTDNKQDEENDACPRCDNSK